MILKIQINYKMQNKILITMLILILMMLELANIIKITNQLPNKI
jgi:hypothetical protein